MENTNEQQKGMVFKALVVFLAVLSVYYAVGIFRGFGHDKGGMNGNDSHVITLSGHGEVQAVPDIANVYFTISKDAKTVKEAQDTVAGIEKKAIDVLKANNIDAKDYKTTNNSFSPKYESKPYMPCTQWSCPNNNATIIGYTAAESITVKVRNTDTVAKIMQELGTVGVTDLSGPNFSIDDEDALTAQARKEAIADAKAKAAVLAKDLGVDLGDIVNYSEGMNYPVAMYAKAGNMAMDSMAVPAPREAQIPKGENTITSDVTLTFEIN